MHNDNNPTGHRLIGDDIGPYPRILDTGCDYAAGCSVAVPAAVS